jgi:hypothetical protein
MIELSISGHSVTADKVATLLCDLGMEASVSPTTNVCKNEDGRFQIEPGARIIMCDCTRSAFIATVWPALKDAFSLRCGWMDASTKSFRGCTENYIRNSACPGSARETRPLSMQ